MSNSQQAENEKQFVEVEYYEICMEMSEIKNLHQEMLIDIDFVETTYEEFNASTQAAFDEMNELFDSIEPPPPSENDDGSTSGENENEQTYDEIKRIAQGVDEDAKNYVEVLERIESKSAEIDSRTNALKARIEAALQRLLNGKGTDFSSVFVGYTGTEAERTDTSPPDAIYAQLTQDMNDNLVFGVGAAGRQFAADNKHKFEGIEFAGEGLGYLINQIDHYKSGIDTDGDGIVDGYETPEGVFIPVDVTPFNPEIKAEIIAKLDSGAPSDDYEAEVNDFIDSQGGEAADLEREWEAAPSGAPDMSELNIPRSYGSWTGDYLNNGSADSGLENLTLNRVLITEYGMQMMTNYITNRKIVDSEKVTGEETITGIPLHPNVNYLYGAEMEYLFGGSYSAKSNFKSVITTLSIYFYARNLVFTFQDNIIKGEISLMRKIPFGVGWLLGELYRQGIVIAETILDINRLKDGKKVPLLKTASQNSPQGGAHWTVSIGYALFNNKTHYENGKSEGEVGLYYDEYLRLLVLLNFTASTNKIADRLSHLIELNINNYMYGTGGSENGTLPGIDKFKLSKATVLADAELTGSIPYYFIWMPFLSDRTDGDSSGFPLYALKTRGY